MLTPGPANAQFCSWAGEKGFFMKTGAAKTRYWVRDECNDLASGSVPLRHSEEQHRVTG